jgi:predicted mannosyl-3-phosphoglycerate phosphatase (HAD superfamily)
MQILIDFDGTVVTHAYPKIGYDIGAVPVLKELVENGHQLILFTMRSDKDDTALDLISDSNTLQANGKYLSNAVKWFAENDITLKDYP